MKQYIIYAWFYIFSCLAFIGCQQVPEPIASTFKFIEPTYDTIELQPQSDSLHFLLDSNSYNQIRTFNYFINKGKPYIAFF